MQSVDGMAVEAAVETPNDLGGDNLAWTTVAGLAWLLPAAILAGWVAVGLMCKAYHAVRVIRAARRMSKRRAEHCARRLAETGDDEEDGTPMDETLQALWVPVAAPATTGVKED